MPGKPPKGRKPAPKKRASAAPANAVPAIVQQPAAQLGTLPPGYAELLDNLKGRVRAARIKAAVSVNRELVLLYWGIGRDILERQQREGWAPR